MRIKSETLAHHLSKGITPLYLVFGDSPLLIIEAATTIRSAAAKVGYTEREIISVVGKFDWRGLARAGQSRSLFGDRKLVELRMNKGKPGIDGSKALQNFAQNLAKKPNPEVITLISIEEIERKEYKSQWFIELEKVALCIEANSPTLNELPNWIANRLQLNGQTADRESLRYFAEHVEGNLLAAQQEIAKLALLYPEGALSAEQISAAIHDVARYDVEGLRESLLLGDLTRLLRSLNGLENEGKVELLVLWAFLEEIRAIAIAQEALSLKQAAEAKLKEVNVWGAQRISQIKKLAQQIPPLIIKQNLQLCSEIDRAIKGVNPQLNIWQSFRLIALQLCTSKIN